MTATSTDSPKKKAPAPSPKKVSAKTTVGSSKKTEKGVDHLVTCETAAGENTCVVKITKKDLKTFAFMKPLEKEWDKVAEEFPTLKGFLGFVTLLDERGVPLAQKPGSPYSGTAMLFQLDPNGEESVSPPPSCLRPEGASGAEVGSSPSRCCESVLGRGGEEGEKRVRGEKENSQGTVSNTNSFFLNLCRKLFVFVSTPPEHFHSCSSIIFKSPLMPFQSCP